MEIGDLMFMINYKGSWRAHINNRIIAWKNANNWIANVIGEGFKQIVGISLPGTVHNKWCPCDRE